MADTIVWLLEGKVDGRIMYYKGQPLSAEFPEYTFNAADAFWFATKEEAERYYLTLFPQTKEWTRVYEAREHMFCD